MQEEERKSYMTIKETTIEQLIEQGYIIYLKNGEIVKEKAPAFGEITFHYAGDKFTHLTRKETKK